MDGFVTVELVLELKDFLVDLFLGLLNETVFILPVFFVLEGGSSVFGLGGVLLGEGVVFFGGVVGLVGGIGSGLVRGFGVGVLLGGVVAALLAGVSDLLGEIDGDARGW